MTRHARNLRRAGSVGTVVLAVALTAGLAGCRRSEPESPAWGERSAPPAATATATPVRIVALGDSLTAGYGLDADQAYPRLLEERLRAAGYAATVTNAGVSGDTSAGGLRRLDWALEGGADILIVALGGNDALRGLPVDELRRNLSGIVSRAKDRGVAVILAGMEAPPNLGPLYTRGFRQVYRDLADEHDVLLLPFLLDGVAGMAGLNQTDGIHPNAAGTQQVAANLWPLVERAVRTVESR